MVYAAKDIKGGEAILGVPLEHIVRLEASKQTSLGKLMMEKELDKKLNGPIHGFLAAYFLQQSSLPVEE